MHKRKIVIITTGQPSTNPRSVKEAISLSAIHEVTFIYKYWVDWALSYDDKIIKDNPEIHWIMVGGDPFINKWKYYFTRVRHKNFRILNKFFPKNIFIAQNASIRCFSELVKSALQNKGDLYIAHNLGALPAAAKAAKKHHAKYAFDAEDFHRGQDVPGSTEQKRTILLEDKFLPDASYITAASPLIAEYYSKHYNQPVTVINNVFSKKYLAQKIKEPTKPIKLFWFSQTIGRGRGIEDVLLALKEMPADAFSLTLLGKHDEVIKNYFIELGKNKECRVNIRFLQPVSMDEIFEIATQHDIGLALEQPGELNRDLCLTNKIFTYLLAGNAIIFSNTKAQKKFYEEYKECGSIYTCGNIKELKNIFVEYFNATDFVSMKMKYNLQLANKKFNWEIESDKVIEILKEITD